MLRTRTYFGVGDIGLVPWSPSRDYPASMASPIIDAVGYFGNALWNEIPRGWVSASGL